MVNEPEYEPRVNVKDLTYYRVLDAEPNSSASALKRKYYMLARQEHPDKGGDVGKFQRVGEVMDVRRVRNARRVAQRCSWVDCP